MRVIRKSRGRSIFSGFGSGLSAEFEERSDEIPRQRKPRVSRVPRVSKVSRVNKLLGFVRVSDGCKKSKEFVCFF